MYTIVFLLDASSLASSVSFSVCEARDCEACDPETCDPEMRKTLFSLRALF